MIVFIEHAEDRLREREISKKQIYETLEQADFILPGRADRKIAIKRFGERFLKVVFIKEENDIIVITAHWISKFKPKE